MAQPEAPSARPEASSVQPEVPSAPEGETLHVEEERSGVAPDQNWQTQCGQVLTDGGDLSVLYIQLHRPALGVDSVDEQHKIIKRP